MIILPIGHDKEIFHLPYVTVGIVAVCLALQVYSALTEPSDEERARMLREEQQIRLKIWREHSRQWLQEHHPDLPQAKRPRSADELIARLKRLSAVRDEFFKAVEEGRVGRPDDPGVQRLRQLERQRTSGEGLLSLGYRWQAPAHTLVTYAFVHAGWFHLIGNMIFLYLCGCNIEDRWGRGAWTALYLLGGAAAALTWGALHRSSPVPLVGASGAIAAAMGAFLVLNYSASIQFLYFFWWFTYPVKGTFYLKAYWALPLWLVEQGLGLYFEGASFTPVAYSAHVGGFAFGVLAALAMKALGADRRLQRASEQKATLFSEHPLFLEGLARLEKNDRRGAEERFERLLAEKPGHVDAAVELYRLKQDPDDAARAASRAVVLARRSGDMDTPVAIYADMCQRHPGAPLDERGLFAVAEALERRNDPRAAVEAYEALAKSYPDGSVTPRALINLALLQKDRLNNPDGARQALLLVLQRHGDSAFGARARALLDELT